MPAKKLDPAALDRAAGTEAADIEVQRIEVLLKTGALQSAIFNSANFSSIATDAKGVIQIFNVGAERMLGYAAADVMNKITPADISDPRELIARAKALSAELGTPITPGFEALVFKASRGIEDIYELTYIRKDGSRFPAVVSVTALRDVQDAIIGYLLIGTDNTARKVAEDAVLENEERFRLVIESMPHCIVLIGSDGRIELVNLETEKTFGYRREELIGRNIEELVPERYRPGHVRVRTDFLAAPTVRAMGAGRDLFGLRRDGTEVPVEIGLSPLRIRKRSYVLASIVDITERKRAREAIERANRMRSDFMANVTHELRTPLNSVIGFAGLLKDEVQGPLNAKQAQFAADILASGRRLLALVEGILEMSRLDAAGAVLEREPVEIGAKLEERVAAHRKAAEARGVTMRLDVAPEAGSAELDPKALRRMVDALLDNAIKFNREGGAVAVSARRDDGCLEIAVADTGIGIARKDLAKLFKPLTQLDAGLARSHDGVGLGLALARRIAELYGGTIEVESELGKGSKFTLRFPILEDL